MTSCLAHVTKPSRVAKHSIFLRTATNRGVFREFYARFFMNGRFVSRSRLLAFSAAIALEATPIIRDRYLNRALSLVNV